MLLHNVEISEQVYQFFESVAIFCVHVKKRRHLSVRLLNGFITKIYINIQILLGMVDAFYELEYSK